MLCAHECEVTHHLKACRLLAGTLELELPTQHVLCEAWVGIEACIAVTSSAGTVHARGHVNIYQQIIYLNHTCHNLNAHSPPDAAQYRASAYLSAVNARLLIVTAFTRPFTRKSDNSGYQHTGGRCNGSQRRHGALDHTHVVKHRLGLKKGLGNLADAACRLNRGYTK